MKKAIALLFVALVTAPAMNAQEDASVHFGIKLAPNMSWLRPDVKGIKSSGTQLGYTFGLLAEFPMNSAGNYRFATGLFLNSIGGSYTQDYVFVSEIGGAEQTKELETKMMLRYVELPFTIKMMTNEIGYMRYFGQLGISTSFNIRARADTEYPVLDDLSGAYTVGFGVVEDEDIQSDINLFRAALVIGGGLEYNFSGNTSLLVGITYNNGFTNILNDVDYQGDKAKVLNDYLELNLGVFF